jgi:hypothetical protein
VKPENIDLGPTQLLVNFGSVNGAELVAILDVLDQLVAQIWESHGPAISQHLLERRRSPPPEKRRPDLPF